MAPAVGTLVPHVMWGDFMKALIKVSAVLAVSMFAAAPALADGFKDCTKLAKASWKPASEAEAKAKELGYEVRRSKVEGSCYEVYGVKEASCTNCSAARGLQPEEKPSKCK